MCARSQCPPVLGTRIEYLSLCRLVRPHAENQVPVCACTEYWSHWVLVCMYSKSGIPCAGGEKQSCHWFSVLPLLRRMRVSGLLGKPYCIAILHCERQTSVCPHPESKSGDTVALSGLGDWSWECALRVTNSLCLHTQAQTQCSLPVWAWGLQECEMQETNSPYLSVQDQIQHSLLV